jgi:hypothetical protein
MKNLLLILLFVPFVAFSQVTDPEAYRQILENYFQDNDQAGDTDAQTFLESMEDILAHPIDLNI